MNAFRGGSRISDYKGRKLRICLLFSLHPLPIPSLPSLSFIPLPSPPPYLRGLPNPARKSGERCELPQRVQAEPGRQAVSGAFWVENRHPVIALLQRFSNNKIATLLLLLRIICTNLEGALRVHRFCPLNPLASSGFRGDDLQHALIK